MATLTKDCDLAQGYSPSPDGKQPYGYILSLTIGNVVLPADVVIMQAYPKSGVPPRPGSSTTRSAFGVLDLANWVDTAPTQPIDFTARISAANRQRIASMVLSQLPKVVVSIDFVVNEYDRVVAQYYTSFKSYSGTLPSGVSSTATIGASSASPIYGVLAVVDGAVAVNLGSTPQQDLPGFTNYAMTMRLAPPVTSTTQKILVQTSPTNKIIRPWGLPQS
jgi:hypothetical protein